MLQGIKQTLVVILVLIERLLYKGKLRYLKRIYKGKCTEKDSVHFYSFSFPYRLYYL